MNHSQLSSVVPHLCREFGIEPSLPNDLAVRRLPDRDAFSIGVTLPRIIEEIEISGRVMAHGAETVLDHFEAGRDRLFAKALKHISKFNDTRVRQLESALEEAIALIDSRVLAYGPEEYEATARLRMIQRGTP